LLKSDIITEINKSGTSKKIIELFLRSFNITYIPKRNQLNNDSINEMKIKPIFYSRSFSLKIFKEKILKIFYGNGETDNIRLWKMSSRYCFNILKDFLCNNIIGKDLTFDRLTYLECNLFLLRCKGLTAF
jgi:hypothetical protein